jgi:hypothetical protein
MKKQLIVLVTLILTLVGCNDNSTLENELNNNKVLIPLTVGNQWKYNRTFYDSSGTVLNRDTILCNVEYDTVFENEKWYKTFWGYLNNKPDGVHQYFTNPLNVQILQWPFPSSENNSYITGANGIITVISIKENYTTPLKTFKCYHYKIIYDNSNNYEQDYYFCPGIGYVKWEDGIKSSSGKYYHCNKYELISYVIAKEIN